MATARKAQAKAMPRGPGRPRAVSGDPRARLLDAAVALFSKHGVAATPLRAIAQKAKVTPAMLHYYFGNRDQLIDALASERISPLVQALGARMAAVGEDSRALVHGFVHAVGATVAANPWLPPLWVREVLGEGGALRERLVGGAIQHTAPALRDRIVQLQKRGALNTDLDPRLLVVSLIGLTLFQHAAAPIWRRLFAADDVTADAMTRHTLALLDRGLEFADAS